MTKWILTLSCLCFLGSTPAFAGGKCKGNDAGLGAFCGNLSEQGCGFASSQCSWEKSEDDKVVRVIVEKEKKCVAKDGYEAHEGFCNNQGKATCKVHSLCTWE